MESVFWNGLPKVSIIVLNYNGKKFLARCLSSLREINYPHNLFEVLLLDNSSNDGSLEFVKTNFPWIKRVSLDKNYGFCGGNNRGLKYANGEYIAFLNNDTQVTPDWLISLVKAAVIHSVPICASKTLFMKNPYIVEYKGAKFTLNGRGYGIAFGKEDSKESSCSTTGYPCAAAMLIKRDVFLKVGQFDEDYFACLDDTDLGWRAWLFGYEVLYCPTSIVYHVAGGTTGGGRISPLKTFHGTKNGIMNLLKNLEARNLLLGIILTIGFNLFDIMSLLRNGDVHSVKLKVKAYFWVIKNLPPILRKRYVVQRNRVVSDKWLLKNGLMALPYESIREYMRLSKLNFTAFLKV